MKTSDYYYSTCIHVFLHVPSFSYPKRMLWLDNTKGRYLYNHHMNERVIRAVFGSGTSKLFYSTTADHIWVRGHFIIYCILKYLGSTDVYVITYLYIWYVSTLSTHIPFTPVNLLWIIMSLCHFGYTIWLSLLIP